MPRPCPRRLLLAASLALLAGPAALAPTAAAAPPAPAGLPHGARELGVLPATAQLRGTVTLRPRHPRALAAYAAAVSDPGSPDYHRYLSVRGFAARFAPTPVQRRAVRARLAAAGLTVGAPSANGLALAVSGSAGETAHAFSAALARVRLADGREVLDPVSTPHLAGPDGDLVRGLVGLSGTAPGASVIMLPRAAAAPRAALAARAAATTPAGPQPCSAASSEASAQGGNTAAAIAARYGMSAQYAAGNLGRGQTIAVYELEPFSASDIAAYQSCMHTTATVEVETVDGGAGSGAGSGEAALDVESLIGLVPQATIRVYEAPDTGQGAYAAWNQIVSDDAARVVSTSWGVCEADQGTVAQQAENTLFQEAAAQGQTVVAAAGDSGADDCGNGTLSVDDPSSQPYVTAVGGTSVHGADSTVWNDSLGAGGGGASQLWPRPSWQSDAVAQTAVSCGAAGNSCREVPDVALDADPETGYVDYWNGAWRTAGGTSGAAPTFAALVALADASPACAAAPLGFLDPDLYAHAAQVLDVTSGENSFGGVSGFPALPGYDMASGLGTPSPALGPALCGDSLTLPAPAAQGWTVGHGVELTLAAVSTRHAAVTYSATGLPAGVTLAADGTLSGTPTQAGRFPVTVDALDADGSTAQADFTATVAAAPSHAPSTGSGAPARTAAGAAPRGSGATRRHRHHRVEHRRRTVRGRVGRHLSARIALGGRAGGPGVRYRVGRLPGGLRLDRSDGVISGTPRVAGARTVTLRVSGAAVTLVVHLTVRVRGEGR